MTIHPLLQVERSAEGELLDVQYARTAAADGKPESFIHFEIVRETDAAMLAAIEAGLASALRHVRAAVEDWPAMLERLRTAAADLRANPAGCLRT